MPDVFDQVAPPQEDIFDQVASDAPPLGDVFDQIAPDKKATLRGTRNAILQEAEKGAGAAGKGMALLTGTMPAYGSESGFYPQPIVEAAQRRIERTPSQTLKDVQQAPGFEMGTHLEEDAPKRFPVTPQEDKSFVTKAARMAGGFVPMIASGPMAPVTIGLQSAGDHISSDFDQAKADGLDDDAAATRALNRATASGTLQAGIFFALPKPVRAVAEKYLVEKLGQAGFARWLTGRIAAGSEGALLGGASKGAENIVEGRPVGEDVLSSGAGLAGANLLLPWLKERNPLELTPGEQVEVEARLQKARAAQQQPPPPDEGAAPASPSPNPNPPAPVQPGPINLAGLEESLKRNQIAQNRVLQEVQKLTGNNSQEAAEAAEKLPSSNIPEGKREPEIPPPTTQPDIENARPGANARDVLQGSAEKSAETGKQAETPEDLQAQLRAEMERGLTTEPERETRELAAPETITGGSVPTEGRDTQERTGSAIPADEGLGPSRSAAPSGAAPPKTPRADQGRPWDIIDEVESSLGGKISLTKARELIEDFKPIGAARKLFAKDGYAPDVAAQAVGRFKELSDQDFLAAINDAAHARKGWRKTFYGEERKQNVEAAQTTAFERDVHRPGEDREVLVPDDLFPGDEFELNGTKLRVREFQFDDNGEVSGVTLDDGKKYGTQQVQAGTRLNVDKGSLQRSEKEISFGEAAPKGQAAAAPREPALFGEPESVAEQKAREAREAGEKQKAAQKEKLAERAAQPLVGSQGDIGQGDLLGGGDLFSGEKKPGKPDKVQAWIQKLIDKTDPLSGEGRLMEGVTGAPVWLTKTAANGALRVLLQAYKGGKKLLGAINEAVRWLEDQKIKGFNQADAQDWLLKEAKRLGVRGYGETESEYLPTEKTSTVQKPLLPGEGYSAELFQGRGATAEEIYGAEAVRAGRAVPILGHAEYFAKTAADAAIYGKVSRRTVDLAEPVVIDSDAKWRELLEAAGTTVLDSRGREWYDHPERIAEAGQKLQAYLVSRGYDGAIIEVPPGDMNARGESIKALAESFGHDQVVKFPEQPEEKAPEKSPSGRPPALQDAGATEEAPPAGLPHEQLAKRRDEVGARLGEINQQISRGGMTPQLRSERYQLAKESREIQRSLAKDPEYVADLLRKMDAAGKDLERSRAAGNGLGVREAGERFQDLSEQLQMVKPDLMHQIYNDLVSKGEIAGTQSGELPAGRTLGELTRWLQEHKLDSPKMPLRERFNLARRLADDWASAKDKLAQAGDRVSAMWQAFKAQYKAPPTDTEFRNLVKDWFFLKQWTGLESHRWVHEIRAQIPDPTRRAALSVWMDADGDHELLRAQASEVPAQFRRVWETAQNLTTKEQALGRRIERDFEGKLDDARNLGLLDKGREHYGVPQIWRVLPKHEGEFDPFADKTKPRNPTAKLDPRAPFFSLERTHPTYFDGIMAGGVPKSLDVGALVGVYNEQFHNSLADRGFIKALREVKASDGMPGVMIAGGVQIKPSEGGRTYFFDSNRRPAEAVTKDGQPYRSVDHWALKGWKFASQTEGGNPIFQAGEFLVHPEFHTFLKNELSQSALQRKNAQGEYEYPYLHAAVSSAAFLKASKFASATFHLVTIGEHAIFHGILPLTSGVELDPARNVKLAALMRHGMDMGFGSQRDLFEEGVSSHGGIWGRVPGLGDALTKMSDFLFKDYIPKIKAKTGLVVLERNMQRYGKKLSPDQIAELTASQMNAAYGIQNWRLMGSNKTMLDINRLLFTAPDFLLSRAKVAAQALKPYNREQRYFLLAQAAFVYMAARALNYLFDDDFHWEPENALSVVYKGRAYSARFIVNDIWHLVSDQMSFWQGRLGALGRSGIEATTQRDMRTGGRIGVPFETENKTWRAAQILVKDMAMWLVPMGAEGVLPGAAGREQTGPAQVGLAFVGIGSHKYTPETKMWDAAQTFNRQNPDPHAQLYQRKRDAEARTESAYRKLDNLLDAGELARARKEYEALLAEGYTELSIAKHFNPSRPFTGSQAREEAFRIGLPTAQKGMYDRAIADRRERLKKFQQLIQATQPSWSGAGL